MSTRIRKAAGLATLLALAPIALAACGSSGDDTTTTATRPAVSAATADRLAKLSDRIASNLDDGLTCDAAYAADQLKDAVNHAELTATLRPGLEEVATDLVNQVNCPPPPPPPEPEKKPKKDKHEEDEHGNGDEHGPGDENGPGGDDKPGHSEHGGFVPPGQAKIKGEEG
jgi:hypothetical protein